MKEIDTKAWTERIREGAKLVAVGLGIVAILWLIILPIWGIRG